MVRFKLDPSAPPRFTEEERSRLDAMAAAEVDAAARSDLDNPPLTEAELEHLDGALMVRTVRLRTGLSQAKFAQTYQINPARLRDLEQGRSKPDSALRAYLTVIAKRPEVVAVLDEGPLVTTDADMRPDELRKLKDLRERAIRARRIYDEATHRVRSTSPSRAEVQRLVDSQDSAREAWARAEQDHGDFLARFSGRNV